MPYMQVQSNKIKNNLRLDILLTLMEAPNYRLQSNQILKTLHDKYVPKPYCDGAFDVAFSRAKKALVSEGLLNRENRGHQQIFYNLTKKGQKECMSGSLEAVQQSIKNLEQLISILLSNPARLEEWFQKEEDIFYKETVGAAQNKPETFSKDFRGAYSKYIARGVELWRPIFDSMFKLHEILVKFRAPLKETQTNDCSQFVTVIDRNNTEPLIIPSRLLEGIDFKELNIIGYDKFPEDRRIQWIGQDPKILQQKNAYYVPPASTSMISLKNIYQVHWLRTQEEKLTKEPLTEEK